MVRVANGAAFWGDDEGASVRLLAATPHVDYLTLDYLSELSLSIMALQRAANPSMGYAADFVAVIASLVPLYRKGLATKVITNAGGLNPEGLAERVRHALGDLALNVAVVTGDDVSSHFPDAYVSANAYLGAEPIVSCLEAGADIVITGRVADPSLTVAPALFHHNKRFDDYDFLAGATIAGHLIECGTQVTGGCSTNWLKLPHHTLDFPIAEIADDGSVRIIGQCVSEETIKEQLLYEVLDPGEMITPDVTVSFYDVEVVGNRVFGAKGRAPTDSYKVNGIYRDGYRVEGTLLIVGDHAYTKGKACGEQVLKRVLDAGYRLDRTVVECLGGGDAVPGQFRQHETRECVLRIAASSPDREALLFLARQIAPLVTAGPQGVTGYTGGRPKVRERFGFTPLFIKKSEVAMRWQLCS